MGTDDSDHYKSDRAALQLIATEADVHDNFDIPDRQKKSDY